MNEAEIVSRIFLNITIPREAMCDLWFCCFLNKLKRAEWGEGKTVLKVTKKKEDRPLDQYWKKDVVNLWKGHNPTAHCPRGRDHMPNL
ncbi:hypothetical protein OUZ56_031027 [Daphnia magna]|uniref:Uncharacterized protein n=1 Tax=Daphnia magna TaxID=35525 RepID=A0ABQ9ZT09_9CRUS|nr:hypothetical protein OUZ56_031027 [Daphnia magna]